MDTIQLTDRELLPFAANRVADQLQHQGPILAQAIRGVLTAGPEASLGRLATLLRHQASALAQPFAAGSERQVLRDQALTLLIVAIANLVAADIEPMPEQPPCNPS